MSQRKTPTLSTIDSQGLEIQPGDKALVKEPANGRESYPVEMTFRAPGEKTSQPLSESRWRHDPRSRAIAFIVADDNPGDPRVLTCSDYREPSD